MKTEKEIRARLVRAQVTEHEAKKLDEKHPHAGHWTQATRAAVIKQTLQWVLDENFTV